MIGPVVPRALRLAAGLAACCVLAAACGTTSVTPISEEERCARFGGTWNRHSGQCGGGGP